MKNLPDKPEKLNLDRPDFKPPKEIPQPYTFQKQHDFMNRIGDSSNPVPIVADKKVSFELPKDDEPEESYIERLKKLPPPPVASVKPSESDLPPEPSSLQPESARFKKVGKVWVPER